MSNVQPMQPSETLKSHARHPRNNGVLAMFNGHARLTGPCGDTMEFWLLVHGGVVKKASFITDGCGSSHAAGSMTTVLAEDLPLDKAQALEQQSVLEALGGLPPESEHCALLAVTVLRAACRDYQQRAF